MRSTGDDSTTDFVAYFVEMDATGVGSTLTMNVIAAMVIDTGAFSTVNVVTATHLRVELTGDDSTVTVVVGTYVQVDATVDRLDLTGGYGSQTNTYVSTPGVDAAVDLVFTPTL